MSRARPKLRPVRVTGGVLFLAVVIPHEAPAGVLYTLESPHAEEGSGSFGRTVSGAGDVDLDSHNDVIVGALWEDGGAENAGRAYIFSGNGGELLYTLESGSPEYYGNFGSSVSWAGDVDSDNHADVIVGAPGEDVFVPEAGRAYIFSGDGGALLYALESPHPQFEGFFGCSVSGAGDVNNDGYDDVIVGAEQEDGGTPRSGRAYVFSGHGGALLYTLDSPNAELLGYFGRSVSRAGDVNDDSYPDVIVGADWEDVVASADGRAYVFSGNGGGIIHTFTSPDLGAGGQFGCSVSWAGHVSDDACSDVIVGAYKENAGAEWAGRAYVFDGNGGAVLFALESPNAQYWGWFGRVVSGAGDVNNDGYDDLMVGAGAEDGLVSGSGRAYVLSGRDGGLLAALESPSPEVHGDFGHAVSWVGDVNNDPYTEVIVGACGEDGGGPDAGRAYVFDLAPGAVVLSGTLCNGSLELRWTAFPGAAFYWVYGASNDPYFSAGVAPDYEHRLVVLGPDMTTWLSPNGVTDPSDNWAYLVMAVDDVESELVRSNRVGEFDFEGEVP